MAGVRSGKTVTTTDASTGETTTTHYKYITLSGKLTRLEYNDREIDFIYDEDGRPYAMVYESSTKPKCVYYYILNVQGDVVALMNEAGNVVADYTYDEWGKLISVTGSNTTMGNITPLRYRGYIYDRDTGLYYLQSRYYDPEVGRFINADVFASTDTKDLLGTNMFAYCENNPINNHDSNGDFCIASAIVGGVLNAGLAVAGAYIDSFISGESVKGSDLAVDVIVAFASGFIQGGFSVKWISDAVDIFNMGYTFVNTIEKGGTLEEAVIRTSITYVSTKAGTAVGNQFADDAVDGVSSAIAGAFTQGVINGIEDTGDFLVSAVNSRHGRTSSTRPQKTTTHEVRIHALCAS